MDSSAGGRPPTRPDRASGPRWFAGRFELREELGRGAFAVVHRAWDASRQAEVALKVLLRVEPRAAERFRREAEVLGRLRHPNIVAALESGAADGQPFIVEELVRGPTLSAVARTRPAPGKAAQLARGIAAAVAHAHAAGVVHRDLKPDNVVVDAAGRPRVLDFGIAGLLGAEGPALTLPGAPLGTPGYMAPEQVRGSATPASDVYAVGGVLYELLCGRAPFDGASDALFATLEAPPPRPSDVAPQVPPALDEVVLRCLAKDPGDRFPDADALRDALDAFLEGAIATEPARRPATPRAVVGLVVVALVAVGLALALGLGGLALRPARPRADDAASLVNDDA
ncbi:MAG: serine/threonine protein kinase, partial [Planctomycetes bacterium]|nr:serine/threonine protein kinase [Planctomycetota bacterium]